VCTCVGKIRQYGDVFLLFVLFFLDLAQPFSCLSFIDFGVIPPEREDLDPFFLFLSLLWRVKI
jgi:hypothetical protein